MRSRIDTLVYLRSLNFAGVVMLTVAMALMAATIAGADTQDDPGRAAADEAAVRVDDVMVSGRRLRDEVQVFVDEVAAPPARSWAGPMAGQPVCQHGQYRQCYRAVPD